LEFLCPLHGSLLIAINSRSLAFSLYEPNPPRIFQALFPLGPFVATFTQTTKGWGASIDHSYRNKITKKSGCPVSTNVFLDPTHERVSAVIFCPSDGWHRPVAYKSISHQVLAYTPEPSITYYRHIYALDHRAHFYYAEQGNALNRHVSTCWKGAPYERRGVHPREYRRASAGRRESGSTGGQDPRLCCGEGLDAHGAYS
jgi:hypothetical protein